MREVERKEPARDQRSKKKYNKRNGDREYTGAQLIEKQGLGGHLVKLSSWKVKLGNLATRIIVQIGKAPRVSFRKTNQHRRNWGHRAPMRRNCTNSVNLRGTCEFRDRQSKP